MKKLFKGKKGIITIPAVLIVGLIFLPIIICLLLAWLVSKIRNKPLKVASIPIIGILTIFFGSAYVAAFMNLPSASKKQITTTTPPPTIAGQQTEVAISYPTSIPENSTPSPSLEKITSYIPTSTPVSSKPPTNFETVRVIRVIDGDTVEIEGGKRVRYIGTDTPETVDPRKPVQCFGQEASNKNKELVEGKIISLEKDVSETDKYGRLLRYVYVGNIFVNELLVREGYALSYSYPPDIKYQNKFIAAQKEARDNNRGLWAACTTTPTPTTKPASISTSKPTTTQPSASTASSQCKYSCSGPDKDCADFSTHAEAQEFFDCCGFTATHDPMNLDSVGVGDGVACGLP